MMYRACTGIGNACLRPALPPPQRRLRAPADGCRQPGSRQEPLSPQSLAHRLVPSLQPRLCCRAAAPPSTTCAEALVLPARWPTRPCARTHSTLTACPTHTASGSASGTCISLHYRIERRYSFQYCSFQFCRSESHCTARKLDLCVKITIAVNFHAFIELLQGEQKLRQLCVHAQVLAMPA